MNRKTNYFLAILLFTVSCGGASSASKTKEITIPTNFKLSVNSESKFTPVKSTVEAIDPSQLPPDVYALVNGKPLLDSAIDEKIGDQPNIPEYQKKHVRERIGNFMINQMVLSQIIGSGQLVVDERDLKISNEKFQEILEIQELSQQDFIERNRISEEQLQQSLMIQGYFWSQITEEKVQDKLELIKDRIEQARVVDVILKGGPSYHKGDREKFKQEISELNKRALNGEDFTELAKKYSDDPSVTQHQGRLGPVTKQAFLIPQLKKTIFELKEIGEISEIIETDIGYMIVKLADIQDNMVMTQGSQVISASELIERLIFQDVQKEFHETVRENNTIVHRPSSSKPVASAPDSSAN